jgi:HEPN domain-containing protein
MDAKDELAKTWLVKAAHDLESARRLAAGDTPLLDTAIYHCQQAAEKAVKGWLSYHLIGFERTHDIRLLVMTADGHEPGFADWLAAAEADAYKYCFKGRLINQTTTG